MRLTEVQLDELETLLEGLLDRVPPRLRKTLSGVLASIMLATGQAHAADEEILRSRAKETAEIVQDMSDKEYKEWVALVKSLGTTLNKQEFEDKVGVDFRWLARRLENLSPEEMADDLRTADWRLVRRTSYGPEQVERKLWIRPVEERKAEYAIEFFVQHGIPRLSAIALVGGFLQESRLNEKAVNPQSGAFGIAQWLGSRKKDVPEDFKGQLEYVLQELDTTEKRAKRRLLQAENIGEAIHAAARYERFNRRGEWGERVGYTDLLYDMFSKKHEAWT